MGDDLHFVSPLICCRASEAALLSDPRHDVSQAMSDDDKLIDLNAERAKRVHDLNDKRLNEVRQAFEQAMPLGKVKKKPKNKPKKR
ncbi:hypothetical protein MOQ67_08105 [Pseudomonas sp. LY-1]|uniref:Transcriptional regulator n=9 Tax=Pseudomonas TaxID=286 RepID=A0ABS0V7V4_PSEVE|nr:hypothetical protein [Pseudomonas veronii]MBI6551711.1 hypothetical protein [Pseudomonas veronii]MBI6647587.1 hypothetical protein [Pseudomonas veronii]